jgi:aspartate aminotransferase-like enzyme
MLLLNPGPVTLSERVRRSLLLPDLCHRESEYFALQDEARQRLLSACDLDPRVWTAVLITGSGTAALESMTAALVPEGGRLLNLENGVYGEWIAQICAQYRIARMQDQRNTPFTPAVHAYYAMVEALREFEDEGGRSARYKGYAALAEQVRGGLAELGIDPALAAGQSSVVLRAYNLPRGKTYAELHDALKAEGFVIYAGQGDLSRTLFRISTMGQVTAADMNRLLKCFARLV